MSPAVSMLVGMVPLVPFVVEVVATLWRIEIGDCRAVGAANETVR